jgi:hypothetical protein
MKSVKNIFKNNKPLMDEPEVQELIDYCQELEGYVLDKTDNTKEILLKELVRDILTSCKDTLKDDEESIRFNEIPRIDFKETIENLSEYIREYLREHKIYL